MFSLRNELLQNSAFLRHNRCIELGKRYVALQLSARVKQLSPGLCIPEICSTVFKHSLLSILPILCVCFSSCIFFMQIITKNRPADKWAH